MKKASRPLLIRGTGATDFYSFLRKDYRERCENGSICVSFCSFTQIEPLATHPGFHGFRWRTDSVRISHPSGSRQMEESFSGSFRPLAHRPRKPWVPCRVQVFNVPSGDVLLTNSVACHYEMASRPLLIRGTGVTIIISLSAKFMSRDAKTVQSSLWFCQPLYELAAASQILYPKAFAISN